VPCGAPLNALERLAALLPQAASGVPNPPPLQLRGKNKDRLAASEYLQFVFAIMPLLVSASCASRAKQTSGRAQRWQNLQCRQRLQRSRERWRSTYWGYSLVEPSHSSCGLLRRYDLTDSFPKNRRRDAKALKFLSIAVRFFTHLNYYYSSDHIMVIIRPCAGRRRVLTRDLNSAVIGTTTMRSAPCQRPSKSAKLDLRFLKSFALGAKGTCVWQWSSRNFRTTATRLVLIVNAGFITGSRSALARAARPI